MASASPTRLRTTISQPRASAAAFRTGQVPKHESRQVHNRSPGSNSGGGPAGLARARIAARVGGRVRNQRESAG